MILEFIISFLTNLFFRRRPSHIKVVVDKQTWNSDVPRLKRTKWSSSTQDMNHVVTLAGSSRRILYGWAWKWFRSATITNSKSKARLPVRKALMKRVCFASCFEIFIITRKKVESFIMATLHCLWRATNGLQAPIPAYSATGLLSTRQCKIIFLKLEIIFLLELLRQIFEKEKNQLTIDSGTLPKNISPRQSYRCNSPWTTLLQRVLLHWDQNLLLAITTDMMIFIT